VLGGFFALMILAVAGFAWLYSRWIEVPRVAAYHVPPGARFVARVDLRQIALFAPVRQHVVPVLLQRQGQTLDEKGELERLEDATGVNLGMDVLEVVVAQHGSHFGLVVGGRLPKGGVVEGIPAYLGDTSAHGCALRGVRLCCASPRLCVEQATDGALVAATDPSLLDAMLPSGSAHQELGLEPEGPGSFGLRVPEFDRGAWGLLGRTARLDGLSDVARVEGRLLLEDPVKLRFEGVPRPGASLAEWPSKLERWRSTLQAVQLFAPGQDLAGERALLGRLVFGSSGDRVTAEASWESQEIEQAARSLGAIVGAWLGG
jgi:hypothetical protein